jgi:perosamine synthetase
VTVVRFADGTMGSIVACTSLFPGGERTLTAGGKDGTVELRDDAVSRWELRDPTRALPPRVGGKTNQGGGGGGSGASNPLAIGHLNIKRNIASFCDALGRLRSGATSCPSGYELSGREARRAVALVCAIYQSAREGRAVRVAPPPPPPPPPSPSSTASSDGDCVLVEPPPSPAVRLASRQLLGRSSISNSEIALVEQIVAEPLAIDGGPKAVPEFEPSLFHWPIVTDDDIFAVNEVMRAGSFSCLDVTKRFEGELCEYFGAKHALTYPNGTTALLTAFYAVGVRRGDEVICPAITFWASAAQAQASLGASVVFADVDEATLTLDPADLERRITPRTRAVVAVHYAGHPCDMDAIEEVLSRHPHVSLVEDVSHAQGGRYHGKRLGSFGKVAAFSIMGGKSLACGEGGVLLTSDRVCYERAVAFAHYARHATELSDASPEFKGSEAIGIPWGGIKGRISQTASAMGSVQLRHYDERILEIQAAMNRFWDIIEHFEAKGLRPIRTAPGSGSTMGGWYSPRGGYVPSQLGGVPVDRFVLALAAEGVISGNFDPHLRGCSQPTTAGPGNKPLHLQPFFTSLDVHGDGKATAAVCAEASSRTKEPLPKRRGSLLGAFTASSPSAAPPPSSAPPSTGATPTKAGVVSTPGAALVRESLPVAEALAERSLSVPWFKHDRPEEVAMFAAAYIKVSRGLAAKKDDAA